MRSTSARRSSAPPVRWRARGRLRAGRHDGSGLLSGCSAPGGIGGCWTVSRLARSGWRGLAGAARRGCAGRGRSRSRWRHCHGRCGGLRRVRRERLAQARSRPAMGRVPGRRACLTRPVRCRRRRGLPRLPGLRAGARRRHASGPGAAPRRGGAAGRLVRGRGCWPLGRVVGAAARPQGDQRPSAVGRRGMSGTGFRGGEVSRLASPSAGAAQARCDRCRCPARSCRCGRGQEPAGLARAA